MELCKVWSRHKHTQNFNPEYNFQGTISDPAGRSEYVTYLIIMKLIIALNRWFFQNWKFCHHSLTLMLCYKPVWV